MAAQDLCSLADVKTLLESTTTARDTLIQANITDASDAIIQEMEREFAPVTVGATRTFLWRIGERPQRILDLAPYDAQAITSVTLSPEGSNPQTLTVTQDYIPRPVEKLNGVWQQIQLSDLILVRTSITLFRFGFMEVSVTGDWGFPAVPNPVKRACMLTAAAWARKDIATFGLAGDLQDQSAEPLPRPAGFYAIPPAALKLLNPYRRFSGVV
jgi:hypothetical protein